MICWQFVIAGNKINTLAHMQQLLYS